MKQINNWQIEHWQTNLRLIHQSLVEAEAHADGDHPRWSRVWHAKCHVRTMLDDLSRLEDAPPLPDDFLTTLARGHQVLDEHAAFLADRGIEP